MRTRTMELDGLEWTKKKKKRKKGAKGRGIKKSVPDRESIGKVKSWHGIQIRIRKISQGEGHGEEHLIRKNTQLKRHQEKEVSKRR